MPRSSEVASPNYGFRKVGNQISRNDFFVTGSLTPTTVPSVPVNSCCHSHRSRRENQTTGPNTSDDSAGAVMLNQRKISSAMILDCTTAVYKYTVFFNRKVHSSHPLLPRYGEFEKPMASLAVIRTIHCDGRRA